jgi:hypothetical protein
MRRPWPNRGCCAMGKSIAYSFSVNEIEENFKTYNVTL